MTEPNDTGRRRRAVMVSLLFHRSSDGILVFDEHARLVDVSDGAQAIFGQPSGSMLGQGADALFMAHPSQGGIGDKVRAVFHDPSVAAWRSTVFLRVANGRATAARLSLSAFSDPEAEADDGHGRLVLGLLTPMRDYESYVHGLVQADRLSTVGLLAGSAGHEIKNDLGPLIGYLSLLEAQGTSDPMVPLMRESVRRIHDHVEQVLEPLRPRARARGPVVWRESIDSVVEGMRRAGKLRRVEFVIDERMAAPHDGVVVHADRVEARQIVLNLLTNADDALGDESGGNRGRIEVRVYSDGDQGVCEVRDDGPGMDERQKTRAFDVHFTTKPHHGTGLGLSVVQLIANELGGSVRLQSEPSEGTCVRVSLPLYRRE